MRFWDASALVPLLVSQAHTPRMTALLRRDATAIVWWGSSVECTSAVARLERARLLTAREATQALAKLDALGRACQEVQPTEAVRTAARRLLRVHDLRAGDALQLAAAVLASEGRPATLPFVCLDERLSIAAVREGFEVVAQS